MGDVVNLAGGFFEDENREYQQHMLDLLERAKASVESGGVKILVVSYLESDSATNLWCRRDGTAVLELLGMIETLKYRIAKRESGGNDS